VAILYFQNYAAEFRRVMGSPSYALPGDSGLPNAKWSIDTGSFQFILFLRA
jgi:hypothetical protein